MLIGVHKITLELRFIPDDYEITGTEVVIDDKRRNRDTKKGFWTEDVKEVTDYLTKRHIDGQYELETALAKLHTDHAKRIDFLQAQIKSHNNAWLD